MKESLSCLNATLLGPLPLCVFSLEQKRAKLSSAGDFHHMRHLHMDVWVVACDVGTRGCRPVRCGTLRALSLRKRACWSGSTCTEPACVPACGVAQTRLQTARVCLCLFTVCLLFVYGRSRLGWCVHKQCCLQTVCLAVCLRSCVRKQRPLPHTKPLTLLDVSVVAKGTGENQ